MQMRHIEAVTKGVPVIKDGFVMMPLNHAEPNELIAYGVEGGFDFAGVDNHGLSVGDKAYYKEAEKKVTHEESGNTFIGRVALVEGNKVEVKINTGV